MSFLLNHNPGRTFTQNGVEYLYFGGTSYLGLQTHPDFLKTFAENIMQFGSSHGASRNSNVQLELYQETEQSLARFTGAESCLTTSSGFMAGQILREYMGSAGYELFHYPGSHAALRLASDFQFETPEDLRFSILNYLRKKASRPPVLFFDSISFTADHFPDYSFLKSLPLDQIVLVADDSHGIGVVGEEGSGCYAGLKALGAKDVLICGSLAKAMATPGGFILGSRDRMEVIRQRPVFAGASPASPAAVATLGSTIKQISLQHQKLKANLSYFLENLENPEFFQFNPGHAGFNFGERRLVNYLKDHHIIVTDFEYAGGGTNRLTRIVITALHTREDLDHLLEVLKRYFST
ncbi:MULTISPECIES: aminotransferase class I/II-fold pyridoxal phosphate-dependent enzyme [unclassified Leeuwenhoekiella]|uniref:aminotransferase class I/II-fold pyridoxal phosphate-dependent enzyme n=1 Tax=unclassified Leeuwenhoekiella TaxID=2615029 RepID=UPI000C359CF6|nr:MULTISPECIES: aminotransferase class I/II-fold pyridoxal phosphate-dependent enzyme [unclassified Leeuwenhoekiella]MAW94545.1 8-amino-7-oxononanoate synthase [Leeuwenhoekiella sp.]MBA81968.1 8-amino-7-oxononanoate synthase [Leeuwenhoekiella sp.]|tara:strand:+ start:6902 stop:7954 length:1053 start_codon:yes stop_codon:yes gene_type:complete